MEEQSLEGLRSLERGGRSSLWESSGLVPFWRIQVGGLSKGPALAYWRHLTEREVIFWRIAFNTSMALGRIA